MELSFAFDVTPWLKVIFYFTLIAYTIFTIILYYHWQHYAMSKTATTQTFLAYFVISIPLILGLAGIAFLMM